jgi:PAS domain S-box-containing protein
MLMEHAFERGQREVLELIAAGAPLTKQLERIVLLIEAQAPGMTCSILLLERAQGRLRSGAAPHLPAEFVRAIESAQIGPREGSCGSAAFLGERVIVEDIATHENWTKYRELPLAHGLNACWSTPILSSAGQVLGTFAMYFGEPRGPNEREIHWIERATHIAAIAIQREINEAKIRLHAQVHDLVSDVIFYIGVEPGQRFRFLSINPAFGQATGLSDEQVVNRLVEHVIPEPSLSVVLGHYRQAIIEKRTVRWQEITPYPAGVKHGEATITPIFSAAGECTHLMGTVHDVTEQHRAQEKIAAQAALLDQAHDAILVWNVDGSISYFNAGAERLYGWSRTEAVGQDVAALIHGNPGQFAGAQRDLIAAGSWRGQLEQRSRTGKALVIEASWTLLRDELGSPRSVFAINTDVTEKRKLELQLFRAQRLESLVTLVVGIAHDFNNVLGAVSGNASLALLDAKSEDAREALSQIERASARGAELVRQMLTFASEQEPKRGVVELSQITMEALGLLRASLAKAIELRISFAHDLPKILADSTQVHQVVINLVTNAAHAMAASGGVLSLRGDRVVIEGGTTTHRSGLRPGTYARLSVCDTGTGMTEDVLQRIFDPFFTTKQPGHGTGLGLAVVHGIVRAHQGGVVVRSTPGTGSEFEVYFPAEPGG